MTNVGIRDSYPMLITRETSLCQELQEIGLNDRLADIASMLGLSLLRCLEVFKQRLAQIVARYQEALSGVRGLRIPVQLSTVGQNWRVNPLGFHGGRRREISNKIREQGVEIQVKYTPSTGICICEHRLRQGLLLQC